jgi:hypothetical protein
MNRTIELYDIPPVRLESVRRYLTATGWRRLKQKEGVSSIVPYEMYRSEPPSTIRTQLILPLSEEAADWTWRVRDAIQSLSEAEERGSAEIVHSIQRIGYDIVRSAIPSEHVKDDTVQLTAAADFVANMRILLAAAATTERRPLPYFGRLLKDSVQFADACRFGHTYRGSFGFVVESPLPDPEPLPLLPDDPPIPFERRVVQRLARGIGAVVAATDARDTKMITSSVATGLGANGYEQLADLIENVNPSGLKISFDLSPAWRVAREMDLASFNVDATHAEVCRSAARELRRDDTTRPVRVAGRVIRLQNQTDPTDLSNKTGEHEIIVLWGSKDLGDILVRVNLSPTDYLLAVTAHGSGRPIWVSGSLTRSGRQWFLANPYDFQVPTQGELPLGGDES